MSVLFRNGLIVDGTGAEPYVGDLLVEGDRIRAMGTLSAVKNARVVDVSGRVLIPGLIDPHVHEEWICFVDGRYELFLRQGVTTVINGNCGHSIVPGPTSQIVEYYYGNGLMNERQRSAYASSFPNWEDFDGYAAAVAQAGTNLNFCTLLGHGSLRWHAMGGAHLRPPSPREEGEMLKVLQSSLEQGAFGLSFGLDYVPGRYADLDELVRFSRPVAAAGGVAAAHLRHSLGVLEATREFLAVGRESGVKLQVSHLRASCPEAFDAVWDYARLEGPVLADTIPASAYHCQSRDRALLFMMSTSDELFGEGLQGVKQAIRSPRGRALLRKDPYFVGLDQTRNTLWKTGDPSMEGRSVAELASRADREPAEFLLDLLASDQDFVLWSGGADRSDFSIESHGPKILDNPFVCAGSDEILGDPEYPFDWYELLRRGAMPTFIQGYLKKGVPLIEAVRRNTSMVADHFSIAGRGRLAPGEYADIAVLDLARYRFPSPDEVTPLEPLRMASGVDWVMVNGRFALEDGQVRRANAGRVLRRGQA